MKIQFFVTLIIFLTGTLFIKAHAQIKCKIESYTTEDGLSHDNIRDIIKDKEGFIWLATWDGINRFDGKNFITYKATAGDNSTLGNNRIDLMKEDAYGYIWVKAYDRQIYRFEKSTEKFVSVADILATNKIEFEDIITAKNGNVWLTTVKKGIFLAQKTANNQIKLSHFSNDLKGSYPPASNKLNAFNIDTDNDLWVGSEDGLDVISKFLQQSYRRNRILQNRNINCIISENNNIWTGTKDGELICYNKISKKISSYKISIKTINSIIKSKNGGVLFITTATGQLLTFDLKTFKINSTIQISQGPIFSVYPDKSGLLWIEPEKHGVFLVDPKSKNIKFFSQQTDATFLQLEHSFGVFEDNFDRVWVKLKGGGFGFYNKKENTLDFFYNRPGSENQKFSNIVASMYFDPSGILWMSTNDRGINKVIFQKDVFQQQLLVTNTKNKSENEIRSVFTDHKNRLWIASKAGKVKVYKNSQEIKNFFVNYTNGDIGLVYSIVQDKKGNIWLGTKGNGLYKAESVNKESSQYRLTQFKTDKKDPNSIGSNAIYSVLEDQNARIWIGTYGGGLNLMKEENGKISFIKNFKNYPITESSRVRFLIKGYKGEIWAATTNGLITFSPRNYNPAIIKFSRHVKISGDKSSLASNDVIHLYKDSQGKIWVSSAGGGLNRAFEKDNRLAFQNFSKQDGLPSDFILSMAEDNDKNLWLATENGISKFNLTNHTFRNYDSYDGLLKTGFSESSSLKLPNGNLIFGCRNGYLDFNPKKIENQKITAQLVFTSFEINNKSSNVKSEEYPLKADINYNKEIELDYQHNTVSIYYTVLDYRSNNKQLYAYRLKGLDDTWHEVKNQKKATFTNLPPGDYEFEVKSLNPELYSSVPHKSLKFTITPPFWKTNWAFLLYFIICAALLETSRRIASSMIQLRNKVIVEQEMTELKLSFFTNISHELRTPLTLIVNPLEEIAKTEDLTPQGHDYIATVRKNTNRLVRFVNQLLDFRKVQSGNEELHAEPVELVTFINEINSLFVQTSHEKNIRIKTDYGSENLIVNLDREKMDIVLYNLLSNAFKFSPDNSTITIAVKVENEILEISIADQGTGVEESKLEEIFKLYYETNTGKAKNVGTGIGLALCREYVKLHQGNIYAENNGDGGLTVFIKINLNTKILQNSDSLHLRSVKIKEQGVEIETVEYSRSNADPNSDMPVVLIVEDNAELRSFLKVQLQKYYRILEAPNGKEGLKMAVSKLPDLILSDVMMPEMNGIELLDALKNTTETSHIPVILLTAKSSVENQIEGLNYGADYYITKPFNNDFLLASIENLIKFRKKFFKQLQSDLKTIALEPGEIVITTKDEQFLKDVIAVVEKGLTDTAFNIEVIANSMNMSRVTFNRKFKSLTGMTPVEFVKEMRVKRAKQFLDAGETDIADIGYRVGFNSSGYFSTCFKEVFQMSPSDYLKQKSDNQKTK
ncbi:hybrid sensor histidine kinase/response regulator transcription factor [Flavobacterium sp. 3-218]